MKATIPIGTLSDFGMLFHELVRCSATWGCPKDPEPRASGAQHRNTLLECTGGGSATDVTVQQMCMNDLGKLGPCPLGWHFLHALSAGEGSSHEPRSGTILLWGVSSALGDVARNGFFLGLRCVWTPVCV